MHNLLSITPVKISDRECDGVHTRKTFTSSKSLHFCFCADCASSWYDAKELQFRANASTVRQGNAKAPCLACLGKIAQWCQQQESTRRKWSCKLKYAAPISQTQHIYRMYSWSLWWFQSYKDQIQILSSVILISLMTMATCQNISNQRSKPICNKKSKPHGGLAG